MNKDVELPAVGKAAAVELKESAPTGEAPARKPGQDARGLLKQLQQNFAVFSECKPLALRIDAVILERMPDLDRKTLRASMRIHTGSTRYLKAVERSQQRFDLDGEAAGEVTEEQRSHASTTLKERFAAQARQQREKKQAATAQKRRADKLQQLVSKFSR